LLTSIVLLALAAAPSGAQPAPNEPVEPDRPDVTNGTHIVDVGLLQIEMGGVLGRPMSGERTLASPLTARLGLLDWLEARLGTDGLLIDSIRGVRAAGIGNVQLGAKLRLWSRPGGIPVLSVLPTVNLPTASESKGLGTGAADYTVALLSGTDLGRHSHVDVNYGLGSIGASDGRPHFVQHLWSFSASAAVTDSWNPYAEAFWLSRQEPGGAAVSAVDAGAIYELSARFALDGGVQVGVSSHAPALAVFGGLSFIVGDVLGDHGVHARERRARQRADARARRSSGK
jgi:hypothetical protein